MLIHPTQSDLLVVAITAFLIVDKKHLGNPRVQFCYKCD
jgi:hypothetical protein